jgi:hypothetical protein
MKGVTIFLAILFFAVNISYSQYPVSGTVMFKDNYEPVNAGKVKAYDLSGYLVSETSINPDGTYMFEALPEQRLDIIGIPGIGPDDDDYIPTIYPEELDWYNAVPIFPNGPLTGINIMVERLPGGGYAVASFISGVVKLDNKPIEDAIVYAKQNNQVLGFGITNKKGEYEINGLPQGDYILVVHRIGASSATRNVNLTMEGLTNVFFLIEEAPFFISGVTPKEFELSQNFPNPFNPATKINYSIPVLGKVKLSVYNSTGQLVDVLVNEVQSSGSYSVSFNGSNLSSGVYLYRIESGSYTETRKMILVK